MGSKILSIDRLSLVKPYHFSSTIGSVAVLPRIGRLFYTYKGKDEDDFCLGDFRLKPQPEESIFNNVENRSCNCPNTKCSLQPSMTLDPRDERLYVVSIDSTLITSDIYWCSCHYVAGLKEFVRPISMAVDKNYFWWTEGDDKIHRFSSDFNVVSIKKENFKGGIKNIRTNGRLLQPLLKSQCLRPQINPSDVKIYNVTRSSFSINWKIPNYCPKSTIIYNINVSLIESSNNLKQLGFVGKDTAFFDKLSTWTLYRIVLKVFTRVSTSKPIVVNITTLPGPPTLSKEICAASFEDNEVIFFWSGDQRSEHEKIWIHDENNETIANCSLRISSRECSNKILKTFKQGNVNIYGIQISNISFISIEKSSKFGSVSSPSVPINTFHRLPTLNITYLGSKMFYYSMDLTPLKTICKSVKVSLLFANKNGNETKRMRITSFGKVTSHILNGTKRINVESFFKKKPTMLVCKYICFFHSLTLDNNCPDMGINHIFVTKKTNFIPWYLQAPKIVKDADGMVLINWTLSFWSADSFIQEYELLCQGSCQPLLYSGLKTWWYGRLEDGDYNLTVRAMNDLGWNDIPGENLSVSIASTDRTRQYDSNYTYFLLNIPLNSLLIHILFPFFFS